jgi:hypothetical protein
MEITNGQPWQSSSQNSVFWRGAECHCQVAEFLLHQYKILIKVSLELQLHYLIVMNMLYKETKNKQTKKEYFNFLA